MPDSRPGRVAPSSGRLVLSDQPRDALRAAARRSIAREHGGILVGYRSGVDIVVEDILEVPDATANRTSYLRREDAARQTLTEFLKHIGSDTTVGYVGEWHTHPAPLPPSPTDQHAMRIMVRGNRYPVALVVAALHADTGAVDLHALISKANTLRSRFAGRHETTTVDFN